MDLSLNLSHYKNEVLKLAEADDYSFLRASGYAYRRIRNPYDKKGHAVSESFGVEAKWFL